MRQLTPQTNKGGMEKLKIRQYFSLNENGVAYNGFPMCFLHDIEAEFTANRMKARINDIANRGLLHDDDFNKLLREFK